VTQHLTHFVGNDGTTTASCARRSFDAETIFMALVTCSVFLTD
jgi:hypothetical protein